LAKSRWNTSWSVLPLVVSAATVTRLRSFADSSVRSHTSPNSTSSVKPTRAGAKSPNMRCAPDGCLSSAVSVIRAFSFRAGRDQQADTQPLQEPALLREQRAEHGDRQRAADLSAGVEHSTGGTRLVVDDTVE